MHRVVAGAADCNISALFYIKWTQSGWAKAQNVHSLWNFIKSYAMIANAERHRELAQFGSALRSGRRGHGFESRIPDHFFILGFII